MRIANMTNGLAFLPFDEISYFQSCYAHHAKLGYFRIDAMPLKAVVNLLKGETITIIDACRKHKELSDALKFGVPAWCIVFNRALNFKGSRDIKVCEWQTPEMKQVALSQIHKPLVQTIRKLIKIYDYKYPAIISNNVILECHTGFIADDKPSKIKDLIYELSNS